MTPCAADAARWAEASAPDAAAQHLCRTACPIRKACLDQATSGKRVMGIWGGLFFPDFEKHPRQHKNQLESARHARSILQEVA